MRPGEYAAFHCADCDTGFAVVLTGLPGEFQEADVAACPFCGSTEEIGPAAPPAQTPYRATPYVVLVRHKNGVEEPVHHGFDRVEAEQALADAQARSDLARAELVECEPCYVPPGDCPQCQCRGNPLAPMLCPFGHLTECHYPLTCEDAECAHLAQYL